MSDFSIREQTALKSACSKTGFIPSDVISKSSWWGSREIGASHYVGQFRGKKAVLKLQGVKPQASEAELIARFERANKSKTLRPPYLYAHLPWDEEKQYEGLILEWVGGEKVITKPAFASHIALFFSLYDDYRANCLSEPFVQKPKESLPHIIMHNFSKLIETSKRLYPDHELRMPSDSALIMEAVHLLCKEYEGVALTFQHGHLSHEDLYWVEKEVVILSNLYWSWKAPFYDRVFAYHWFLYDLSDIPEMIPEIVEQQKELFMEAIDYHIFLPEDKRLLRLAKFERAIAGLNLDALSIDPKKEITKYLVESTRKEVIDLMEEIEKKVN